MYNDVDLIRHFRFRETKIKENSLFRDRLVAGWWVPHPRFRDFISDRFGKWTRGTNVNEVGAEIGPAVSGDSSAANSLAHHPDLLPVPASYSCWFKETTHNAFAQAVMLSKATSFKGFHIAVLTGSNIRGSVSAGISNTQHLDSATSAVTLGKWHHVLFSIGPLSGPCELFLDGKSVATATLGGSGSYSDGTDTFFAVGGTAVGGGGANNFQGHLGPVLIWNRTFSPSDAALLYNTYWEHFRSDSHITFFTTQGTTYTPSVTSTLSLSQTVNLNTVLNREILNTLSLTQDVTKGFNVHLDSTLSLSQTVDCSKAKSLNVSDTLSLTQSIDTIKILNKNVVNTLNLSQTIVKNVVLNKSVTSTLNLTQTILASYAKAIKNTLTFSQTIDVTKGKHVKQQLNLSQLIARNIIANRTVNSNFGMLSRVARTTVLNRSITSNLNLSQTIIANLVRGVTHNLIFTQTIDVVNTKLIKDLFIFSQIIGLNYSLNKPVTNELNLTQTIAVSRIKNLNIISNLIFEQFYRKFKVFHLAVTNTLPLTQEIYRTRYSRSITSNLNFTQTIACQHITNRTIQSNLNLTQTITKQSIFTLHVTNILTFPTSYLRYVGGIEIEVPTLLVAKTQPFTLLKASSRIITLPNPEFGDGESNTGLFTVRRGMRGKLYTYVKKTDFRKLTYTFNMSKPKARELQDFLDLFNSELLQLENWKGEIWRAYITNNPVEFNYTRRAEPCDRERVEVTLEFEGIKLGTNKLDQ